MYDDPLQTGLQDGHVLVIAPVCKVDREVVRDVVMRIVAAITDRRHVAVIDAYGLPEFEHAPPLEKWSAEAGLSDEIRFPALAASFTDANEHAWRSSAARAIEAARSLRAGGRHVVIVGPFLLPENDELYAGAVAAGADGLLVLGRSDEVAGFMESSVDLLAHALPPEQVLVLTYVPVVPGGSNLVAAGTFSASWFDLGVVSDPMNDINAAFFRPAALVIGLPELGGWIG
jgi:hypothetical protein